MSEFKALIVAVTTMDPLTLAILFIGLISLGAIKLAADAINIRKK